MKLKIEGSCRLGKKMPTSVGKQEGTDAEIVTCQISVSQVHVDRESMDDLAGLPIGCTAHLYSEQVMPWQHQSFLLPKRALQATGVISHAKDGEEERGGAELRLARARVNDMRFNLQPPREHEQLGRAFFSCTLQWKVMGDETETVEDLLGKACHLTLTLQPPAGETKEMFPGTRPGTEEKPSAGDDAKIEITAPGRRKVKTTLGGLKRATRRLRNRRLPAS